MTLGNAYSGLEWQGGAGAVVSAGVRPQAPWLVPPLLSRPQFCYLEDDNISDSK